MCVGVQPLVTPPVLDVPPSECFVIRGGEQIFAPRMPSDAPDPVVVSEEGEETLTRAHIPDQDLLVPAAAGQEGPGVGAGVLVVAPGRLPGSLVDGLSGGLRGPGDTLHHVVVVSHLHLDVLPPGLPDPDRLVVGAAGQQVAVQRHPHHPHPLPEHEQC